MMKRNVLTLILLALSAATAQAANVVIVTSVADVTTDSWYTPLNSFFDFGGADTLSFGSFTDHTLTGTQDTLEAADLIVFTRNSNSGSYVNTGEVAYWNSLDAALIMSSNLLVRDSRFGWVLGDIGAASATGSETSLTTAGAAYLGLGAADDYDLFTNGPASMAPANTNGDGVVSGTMVSGNGQSVIHWNAGDAAANGDVFGGERLFFGTDKSFALSATGATAIDNVLRTMIPATAIIPESGSYALLAGLLALCAVAMKRRES